MIAKMAIAMIVMVMIAKVVIAMIAMVIIIIVITIIELFRRLNFLLDCCQKVLTGKSLLLNSLATLC